MLRIFELHYCAGFLLATAMAQAQSPSRLELGRRAMAENDYVAAARYFGQASELDKTSEAAVQLGEAELLQPNPAAAEVSAHTAIERDVHNASAHYLLARALQQQNKPAASLRAFTAAAALRAPTGDELRLVALNYVLLNDYPDAIHWLRLAVEKQPRNAEAWYSLGRALYTRGDMPDARNAFEEALKANPDMVRARNNLGLVYEAQNDSAAALLNYQQAVALQQGNAHASEQPLLNLGKLLIERARAAEALEPLRQAVSIAPKDAACHEALARAAAQSNHPDEAEQEMEKAVALDAGNPRMHYELGRLYRSSGRLEKAKEELAISARLYGTTSKRDN